MLDPQNLGMETIEARRLIDWLEPTDHHGSDDPVVALVQPFRKNNTSTYSSL